MMDLSYYPGCTLKTKGKNFEDSAVAAMSALGINLVELPRWNCCGASYCLADDDLIHQVAPVRNLVRAKEQGSEKLLTLCAFCYNTLKRANLIIRNDAEKKDTLNNFMDEEPDYDGEVETVHMLEVLRDDVGWEAISEKVKVPLKDMKVAPYYGCTLVRPEDIALDDVERPTVLHKLMGAIGATAVSFPFETECCGSFQSVSNPDFATECAWNILSAASRRGAEVMVVSCPMCEYNLGSLQKEIILKHSEFKKMPVIYFTQLLALALGLGPEICRFDLGSVDSRPFLKSKGLIYSKRH
jgi:heterodisulfide reductase subunit B